MGIVDIGKYLFLRREQSKAAAFAEPLFTCELAALIRFGSERRSAFYTPSRFMTRRAGHRLYAPA